MQNYTTWWHSLHPMVFAFVAISLLGEETCLHGKRGPTSVQEKQLAQISLLPRAKQKFISQMLDTVLAFGLLCRSSFGFLLSLLRCGWHH